MPRYALRVEFDGRPFVGWQRQEGAHSVQLVVEEAAAPLNGGAAPLATTAGRTDAGVHAEAIVCDVAIALELDPVRVREAMNARLVPHPVAVLAVARVADDWSARFACTGRAYRYRILNRPARPALEAGRVWHMKRRLDAAAMHEAAQGLLGHHDFSAFRAAACQARSAMRTLDQLEVQRLGEEVVVTAAARSFLHHQVRNMVGTLAEVGIGRRPPGWARQVLESRDRGRAGQTAPPDGLYFTAARYDPEPGWT